MTNPIPQPPSPAPSITRRLVVTGTVQGVGFRPFVFRLATELGLLGFVRNEGGAVHIVARGEAKVLDAFRNRLGSEAPPLSRVAGIDVFPLSNADENTFEADGFSIRESRRDLNGGDIAIAPDTATCSACNGEFRDPTDRRHGYHFLNCTDCGPRYSIMTALPYDRPNTSMVGFRLCRDCETEYENPGDRRFHAQPIACPVCGPSLRLEIDGRETAHDSDAVRLTAEIIIEGGIVGVKGLGGFHLACDAGNRTAVERLRNLKRRPGKPFALMVTGEEEADILVHLSPAARTAFTSAAAPIILAKKRSSELPEALAPGLDRLGLMRAYTPIHLDLVKSCGRPLVMTSGNIAGHPQIIDDDRAGKELGPIVSGLLLHDRPIINRIDDSVLLDRGTRVQTLRRARGYAPAPFPFPEGFTTDHPDILAMGGDLKSAIGVARRGAASLSPHIGDLEERTVEEACERAVDLLVDLCGAAPSIIAVDAHPGYRSHALGRRIASETGAVVQQIAHHHAHAASCLAGAGYPLSAPPVLAITLDGIGYGENGSLRGGEMLLADYHQARWMGGLKPTPLIGGDKAAKEPWRPLLAQLLLFGDDPEAWPTSLYDKVAQRPLDLVLRVVRAGMNAPLSSSTGRLFDAVSAALGLVVDTQDYEGEAAMRLQTLAERVEPAEAEAGAYPFGLDGRHLDPRPFWVRFAADLTAGVPSEVIAARFHGGFAAALVKAGMTHINASAADTVCLTGGAAQNALLADLISDGFNRHGIRVLEHEEVPAGDGGLALGQAVVAAVAASSP